MTVFYYLKDLKKIGKRENEEYFLFEEDLGWIKDSHGKITDRLLGFDHTKPLDSSHRIGNIDIIENIKEISAEEVIDLLTRR